MLDTHALLWWLAADARLSAMAREVIEHGSTAVLYSAASIWEIAIKRAAGKLTAPDDLVDAVEADGFVELPIAARHAAVAGALPLHHRDPFDRMIVAQALLEGLTVLTSDERIRGYGVPVIW